MEPSLVPILVSRPPPCKVSPPRSLTATREGTELGELLQAPPAQRRASGAPWETHVRGCLCVADPELLRREERCVEKVSQSLSRSTGARSCGKRQADEKAWAAELEKAPATGAWQSSKLALIVL